MTKVRFRPSLLPPAILVKRFFHRIVSFLVLVIMSYFLQKVLGMISPASQNKHGHNDPQNLEHREKPRRQPSRSRVKDAFFLVPNSKLQDAFGELNAELSQYNDNQSDQFRARHAVQTRMAAELKRRGLPPSGLVPSNPANTARELRARTLSATRSMRFGNMAGVLSPGENGGYLSSHPVSFEICLRLFDILYCVQFVLCLCLF